MNCVFFLGLLVYDFNGSDIIGSTWSSCSCDHLKFQDKGSPKTPILIGILGHTEQENQTNFQSFFKLIVQNFGKYCPQQFETAVGLVFYGLSTADSESAAVRMEIFKLLSFLVKLL